MCSMNACRIVGKVIARDSFLQTEVTLECLNIPLFVTKRDVQAIARTGCFCVVPKEVLPRQSALRLTDTPSQGEGELERV